MRITIKKIREELNMTQSKFSETIGISLRYLQHIESGDRFPSLIVLKKISEIHNISIHDLIDD